MFVELMLVVLPHSAQWLKYCSPRDVQFERGHHVAITCIHALRWPELWVGCHIWPGACHACCATVLCVQSTLSTTGEMLNWERWMGEVGEKVRYLIITGDIFSMFFA